MTEIARGHGFQIFEPRNLAEKARAAFLALGFENILLNSDYKSGNDENKTVFVFKSAEQTRKPDDIDKVFIERLLEEKNIKDSDVPKGFNRPAYHITIYYNNPLSRSTRIDTPYGKLPIYVVGNDDRIYYFQNYCVVNRKGEAIRKLNVQNSLTKFSEKTKETFVKKDIIPSGKDSKYTRLSKEDYEEMERIYAYIKSGKLINVSM